MNDAALQTVGELGEIGTLERIVRQLSEADAALLGPGDDAAVLRHRGDTVITTDTMIEGPDFTLDWHDGFSLGWKLAATNLSDVAAMGARPTALTVAFACSSRTPVRLLEQISAGLDAACRLLAPGCGVVGGDLARSPQLTAAVTAVGDLEGRPPVRRSGAAPGDQLAYAGELGLSGIGFSLLRHGANGTPTGDIPIDGDGRAAAALWATHPVEIAAHLAPTPPVPLGVAAAAAGATAMLDVSDGLALDATRIARASGVTIELSTAALLAGFEQQHGVHVPVEAMLSGGEDHGLLASFPAAAALPEGFAPIGVIRSALEAAPLRLDGAPYEARGWDPHASDGWSPAAGTPLHEPQ